MKKFIEVLIDDNDNFVLNSEMDKEWFTIKNKDKKVLKKLLGSMVKSIWENGQGELFHEVRLLIIAAILSSRQPYEQIEDLWYKMMYDLIPSLEEYSNQLKIPYGFKKNQVVRPIKFGDVTSIMKANGLFNLDLSKN